VPISPARKVNRPARGYPRGRSYAFRQLLLCNPRSNATLARDLGSSRRPNGNGTIEQSRKTESYRNCTRCSFTPSNRVNVCAQTAGIAANALPACCAPVVPERAKRVSGTYAHGPRDSAPSVAMGPGNGHPIALARWGPRAGTTRHSLVKCVGETRAEHRRPCCRSGSRPRSSPAIPSRSSRRRARDCAIASRRRAARRPAGASPRTWRGAP